MRTTVGYAVLPGCASDDEQAHKRIRHDAVASTSKSSNAIHVATFDTATLQRALLQYGKDATSGAHATWQPDVRLQTLADGTRVCAMCLVPGLLGCAEAATDVVLSCPNEAVQCEYTQLASLALPTRIDVADCHTRLEVFQRDVNVRFSLRTGIEVHSALHDTTGPVKAATHELLIKPLLVIGAGGIGCEVLKVLVLSGFTDITLIDLDTIDATNLNRQFLFHTEDVGQPKATVARAEVLRWFADAAAADAQSVGRRATPQIVAYHDNIKSERFDETFFSGFAAVLSALDNVGARQHVNRMCMRVNVPLIESGTMGYNGQVQPIVKGVYECYDCHPKPAEQKSFAVCTIHARPTTMVHCVHFAKELYEALFGETVEDDRTNAGDEPSGDEQRMRGGSGAAEGELSFLRKTILQAWRTEPDDALRTAPSRLIQLGLDLARSLFDYSVRRLLAMKTTWATTPPIALAEEVFVTAAAMPTGKDAMDATALLSSEARHAVLSVADTLRLFCAATARCALRCDAAGVAFRKEDDDAVSFVAATANLRAHNFHIAMQSVEALRTIAGAIVPAIATTNAIVAAGVVRALQAVLRTTTTSACVMSSDGASSPAELQQRPVGDCRVMYVRKVPQARRRVPTVYSTPHNNPCALTSRRPRTVTDQYLVHSVLPNPPNTFCQVCHDRTPRVCVRLDASRVTLGDFVQRVLHRRLGLEGVSVTCAARIVYEEDEYERLAEQPLCSFVSPDMRESGAMHRTLTFLVDALNRPVEWEVRVVAPAEPPSRSVTETGHTEEGDAIDVEGVEAARQTEAMAVALRTALDASVEEQAPVPLGISVDGGDSARNAIEIDDDEAGAVKGDDVEVIE